MAAKSSFGICDLYDKVTTYLPPLFFSEADGVRISALTRLLPQELPIENFGYEAVLNQRDRKVDIGFNLNADQIQADAVRRWFDTDVLAPQLQNESSWRLLQQLLLACCAGGFYRKHGIHLLWFEFDVGSNSQWPLAPNLLFVYKSHDRRSALLETMAMVGNTASSDLVDCILQSAKKYQSDLLMAGFMFARASDWIKLGFSENTHEKIALILQELPFPFPEESWTELLRKIDRAGATLFLQIDIHRSRIAKIGIECQIHERFAPSQWLPLFNLLVAEGLIAAEEVDAALSWIGGTRHVMNGNTDLFMRYLSHLKITYQPGKPLQTKLYLGAYLAKKEKSSKLLPF